ncbi:MAG: FtsX-like permease family protein [Burkholderiales bacterium]
MIGRLIFRNALRHRVRSGLTLVGLLVAILAFGLLATVVDAWYAGADAASATRLVTRSSISLVFPLPLSYRERLRMVDGVTGVSSANWFGGVYVSEKNFFPQFAVDGATYFDLYPEYRVAEADLKAFLRDRKGAVVGRKLADTYGWKVGDSVPLRGTVFPGNWEFVVRAIYDGRDAKTDTSQFFFHWAYLNESVKKLMPRRADAVGVYVVGIRDADRAAEISRTIDRQFRNSLAETLTETEKAFQLGFVSMTEAIVVAIRLVSYLVIFIIMAVMANTMAMSARERLSEYATLKALGFQPARVAWLVMGEAVLIALLGGALGIAATFPVARIFGREMGSLFPVFEVSVETVAMQVACALVIGIVAGVTPAIRAGRVGIAEGLRAVA